MYKTVKLAEWIRARTQAAQARPDHNCFDLSTLADREQHHHYGPGETLWRSVAANTACAVPEANKKRI
jgi:hypothetical protein